MALIIPNLDHLQKLDPKLGEAVKAIQDYSKLNIVPTAGNRTPKPPVDATRSLG